MTLLEVAKVKRKIDYVLYRILKNIISISKIHVNNYFSEHMFLSAFQLRATSKPTIRCLWANAMCVTLEHDETFSFQRCLLFTLTCVTPCSNITGDIRNIEL